MQQNPRRDTFSESVTSREAWCERWNIKINADKTQAIYSSHRSAPVGTHVTLKG
jgi:hypothetical protein